MNLIVRAFNVSDDLRVAWIVLAATVAGTTAWATHFIALLGLLSGTRVVYDPALTLASLILAISGTAAGMTIAARSARGPLPAIGGAVVGASFAGMHYVGMLAYQVEATVRWRAPYLVASVILAIALSAPALAAARGQLGKRADRIVAAALLASAIASLHFTGMAALQIIPWAAVPAGNPQIDVALALSTSIAAGLVIVVGILNHAIDRHSRHLAEEALTRLARTDVLTGLPNRLAANEELSRRLRTTDAAESFALLAMETANIDAINQQYGSSIADRALQALATRLKNALKSEFALARLSGSQFCVMGAVSGGEEARSRAQKVHAALSQDFLIEGRDIRVDVRIGVVTFPTDAADAESLMRKAQVALARAVADPLEPIASHDENQDVNVQRRLSLASDLRGALDRGEFELFYQPQVWIEDRRIIGCEALIRWRHPKLGMISPAEFIPMAEKTGLILPIGEWVLRTACRDAAQWPGGARVAVNLSPLQLRQANLTQCVAEALRLSGLAPDRLEIELTESLLVSDRRRAVEIFDNIRALDVRLVLDDFGTGYSSMEVLRQFPFDKIKLDRSFVGEIEINDQSRAILQAMLTLGRELSTPILVEGVETERQLAILRKYGCNKVQGYLTGRPVPGPALVWAQPERLSA